MRTLLALTLAAFTAGLAVDTADAASPKKKVTSTAAAAERARADNADPSGTYKGYPDWARIALSGKDWKR